MNMNRPQYYLAFTCLFYFLTACCSPEPASMGAKTSTFTRPIQQIDTIYFLIHGLCYSEMNAGKTAAPLDVTTLNYLAREQQCATAWRKKITQMTGNELLVEIPWCIRPIGPLHQLNAFADSVLGDHFLLLDAADGSSSLFWQKTDTSFSNQILAEFRDTLVKETAEWNKEELFTKLHVLNCCKLLWQLLAERYFQIDPHQVTAIAWGASYEGCVTKYSLHLRRFLHLSKPIHIDFDLTVPDALFLLKATELDNQLLKDDLGVVFFQNGDNIFAHYYLTALPVHDNPVFIETFVSEKQVFILSKQGIRLWPDPEPYHIPQAPAGYYEPPQKVIRFQNHKLLSPVSFGYVYRLAKAPVFLFPDSSLSVAEWRHILLTGHIAS